METLTIKTPADVLSFIGHTLGFWPRESLVCVTLADNHIGATLRVDLPTREGGLRYARTVADYLAHDASVARVLFAVYTSDPQNGLTLPLKATQSSQINAEFVYRGSTMANRPHHPARPDKRRPNNRRRRRPSESNTQDEPGRSPRASQDALGRHAGRDLLPQRRRDHQTDCQLPGPPDPRPAWQTSRGSTNRWTGFSWPKHTAGPSGPGSNGHSSCCSTPTHAAAPNTRRPSSPPSPSSTGGKAEAAKPTSSSNSPSKQTPLTVWPGSVI